ncbi:hypothetical protein SDC9_17664 [bioreactor metagenome]|uniref:Uncharacterized protein n=1 Tax=bioreactor metagenome TaxID=1076179 RepID=A0A644TY48_9ZZZZ|nr:hypothetical protein [Lentimicrobium sp.]MEA5111698.1 hypothetical protein [Lentimicrobium sp.]
MSDNTKTGWMPIFISPHLHGISFTNADGTKYFGMSKRFYAACAAMQAFVQAHPYQHQYGIASDVIAAKSFELADALLKEEEKQ